MYLCRSCHNAMNSVGNQIVLKFDRKISREMIK